MALGMFIIIFIIVSMVLGFFRNIFMRIIGANFMFFSIKTHLVICFLVTAALLNIFSEMTGYNSSKTDSNNNSQNQIQSVARESLPQNQQQGYLQQPDQYYEQDTGNIQQEDNYDFLLPTSDREVIDINLLKQMYQTDPELLQLGVNEIYARHGYKFKMKEYSDYFSQKSWYRPVDGLTSDYIYENMLNENERINIENLVAVKNGNL